MERDKLVHLLENQGRECLALAERLAKPYRSEELSPEENRLCRMVSMPMLQEMFEIGLTRYLIYGEVNSLTEGIEESAHKA